MLPSFLSHLPAFIIIIIFIIALMFVLPNAFFFIVALPFLILKEGYERFLNKADHKKFIKDLLVFIVLAVLLILIFLFLIGYRFK